MFCKDFFVAYLKGKGESIIRTGRWWGQVEVKPNEFEDREIDFIGETREDLYFAECKWTNKKTSSADLYNLSKSLAAFQTKKNVKLVLFSKSGFDFTETKNITLFSPERLEMEILKLREHIMS